MTSLITMGSQHFIVAGKTGARGPATIPAGQAVWLQRRPTDAQGLTTLTLTNVAVGSRYRVELAGSGALATPNLAAEGVAASSTVVLSLDYFGIGSVNNNWRIKVRSASGSPTYKPFETLATASAAAQSIFIGQIQDE